MIVVCTHITSSHSIAQLLGRPVKRTVADALEFGYFGRNQWRLGQLHMCLRCGDSVECPVDVRFLVDDFLFFMLCTSSVAAVVLTQFIFNSCAIYLIIELVFRMPLPAVAHHSF